ncbi:MAG: 30S ribosomal protein S9 [Planctomycetes bacterium]|nr:30S ribosomal protein S9 [Planctomycetota bacterium]
MRNVPEPVPEVVAAPAGAPVASTRVPSRLKGKLLGGYYWGTGRRKTSVARLRVRPGTGIFLVNDRDVKAFFPTPQDLFDARAPLAALQAEGKWDVFANVNGGGQTGQAGAVRMGLSRALCNADDTVEPVLRPIGFLTRDSRMKERKKYGQRGARRRFQFSKR